MNEPTFLESLRASNLIPLNLQIFSEEQDEEQEEDTEDEEQEEEEPKTFTQEEVNRMMAKEKRQGKRSAIKELGFKDEKEAKKAFEEYKKWSDSQKTDGDKQDDSAKKLEVEKSIAEKKAEYAERKVVALTNGVKKEMLDDFIALASIKVTDDEDFEDVVEGMKKVYKAFFNDLEDDPEDVGKKGTGSTVKSTKKKAVESTYGKRLAEQRKPTVAKSSYFN